MKKPAHTIILETLDRINAQLASNSNALVISRAGNVDPETAYIELVRELLYLAKE
jgi:hypothetical protein